MFAARNALFTTKSAPTELTIKGFGGTTQGTGQTSVTIPAHSAGDLIVLWVSGLANAVISKPSASGTVPDWVNIGVSNTVRTAYFVATSSTTTSGTWTSANALAVVVLSGQATNPIGGQALMTTDTTTTSVKCPAVTMTKTDGTSMLLHFAKATGALTGYFTDSFPTQAVDNSKYAAILGVTPGAATTANYRVVRKSNTGSSELVYMGTSTGTGWYGSATVEVVAQ